MGRGIENGERLEALARREVMIKAFKRDRHPHGETYKTPEEQLEWVRAQGVCVYQALVDGEPVVLGTLFGYQPYEIIGKDDVRLLTIEQQIDRAQERLAVTEWEDKQARVYDIEEVLDRVEKRLAKVYEEPQGVDRETQSVLLFAFVEGIRDEAFAHDDEEAEIMAEVVLGFEAFEEESVKEKEKVMYYGDAIIIGDKVVTISPINILVLC